MCVYVRAGMRCYTNIVSWVREISPGSLVVGAPSGGPHHLPVSIDRLGDEGVHRGHLSDVSVLLDTYYILLIIG